MANVKVQRMPDKRGRLSRSENKIGRKKATIDWDEVGKYLEAGSPGTAIAAMYGISKHTLYERCLTDNKVNFHDYSQEKRSKGDERLRAKQYQEAMKGDRGMLVWVGKQRLGQKDKHDHELSGSVTNNVTLYGDKIPQTWKEAQKVERTDVKETDEK